MDTSQGSRPVAVAVVRARLTRWARRIGLALAALFGIPLLLLTLLLLVLDAPFVKDRVRALVADATGLRIDYGKTRVRLLSGLALTEVRLLSPPPYDQLAPDLVHAGTIEVGWSLRGLLASRVQDVRLRDLHITVVADDDGKTSLSALGKQEPGPPPTPGPQPPPRAPAPQGPPPPPGPGLSQILRSSLPAELPVDRIHVDGVTLTLIRRTGGQVRDRHALSGLAIEATLAPRPAAPWAALQLSLRGQPLRLVQGEKEAQAQLDLLVRLTSQDGASLVEAQLGVKLLRQDLLGGPAAQALAQGEGQLLSLKAEARFQPEQGRVSARLVHLRALGESLSASAEAELPDGLPPHLRAASAHLDLSPFARLLPVFLPGLQAGLGTGRLDATVKGLTLGGALPSFSPDGQLQVDLAATALRYEDGAGLSAVVPSLALGARLVDPGKPESPESRDLPGKEVQVRGRLGGLTLSRPDLQVLGSDVDLSLDTRLHREPPYRLLLRLGLGALTVKERRGKREAALLTRAPVRAEITATELRPDQAQPLRSQGRIIASLALGGNTVRATVLKKIDAADYQIEVVGPKLAIVRPFAPASYGIPWERLRLDLRSQGSVGAIFGGAPHLRHRTSVSLLGLALRPPGGQAMATNKLELTLSSQGTARKLDGDLDLRVLSLRLGERALGDGRTRLHVALDRDRPTVTLRFQGEGSAGPEGGVDLQVSFERPTRTLRYDASVRLSRLGILGGFLPPEVTSKHQVDWSRLQLSLKAKGTAQGLVRDLTRGGDLQLERDPIQTLRGPQSVDLHVTALHYRGEGGLKVDLPSMDLGLRFTTEGAERVNSRGGQVLLTLPGLHLVSGAQEIDVEGLSADLRASLDGALVSGQGAAALSLDLRARSLRERSFTLYPIGDLRVTVKVDKTSEGQLRLQTFEVDNPRGGTRLSLRGGLDLTRPELVQGDGLRRLLRRLTGTGERLVYGRQSVSLSGRLSQQLDALRLEGVRARGKLDLDLHVESADFSLYHAAALLHLSAVDLDRGELQVRAAYGQIPITQDILISAGRPVFAQGNAYQRLRYADHHPFLTGEGTGPLPRANYFSLERLRVKDLEIGPLAGNLRLERSQLSLDQLDMAVRGAQVHGRLALDWQPEDARIEFQGNVTGLRPGPGPGEENKGDERLDASAALTLGLRRRALTGRVQIVRIGRRHLLDLLDLADPYQADVSMNRIRLALKVGYPKQARLRFEQGFTHLLVELGGLVSAVRIDEVQTPTGPLLQRYGEEYFRDIEEALLPRKERSEKKEEKP